jgi:nucleotide-binding universal stress UspA family protein
VAEPFTAGVVFAASLGLLLARPRHVPEWSTTLGGGLLLLAVGAWTPQQALAQLANSADVLLFFAGLGLTAATAAAFAEFGLTPDAGIVRLGEPGREICSAAAGWQADLVVLRASRRERPEPGSRSVGHTARFVVNHAPCPVLLIRGATARSRVGP